MTREHCRASLSAIATPTVALSLAALLAASACAPAAPTRTAPSAGNAVVRLSEDEWRITSDVVSAPAGKVSFVVANQGKIDHEVVLLKTDLAPGALIVQPGTAKIDEEAAGQNVGEVEVEAGTTGAATFELGPGKYLFVCNIASHYQAGMFAPFEITGVAPTAAEPAQVTTAPSKPVTAAAPAPGQTQEVARVTAVRANLTNLVDTLQKGDIAGARKALKAYNTAWNGVEVYVSFRSPAMYSEVETVLEAKVTSLLDAPQPSAAETLPAAQQLLAKYDEAIKLGQDGPPISPLFDDVAVLRILRTNTLRDAVPAIKAGDVATAKPLINSFINKWADVEDMVHARSADTYAEIEGAMTKVNTAAQKPNPSAAELGPLVDTLSARFNFAVSLVNAAARGADPTKTTFTTADVQAAANLAAINAELNASLPLWQSGKFQEAGDRARNANGKLFSNVSAALEAKSGADAPLQKALDAYAAVSDKPGDAATVTTAHKAAIDAVAVAQQWVVGQFWTDAKLKDAIAAAPKSS